MNHPVYICVMWMFACFVHCVVLKDLNKEGAQGTLNKYYNENEEYNISITRHGYNITRFCIIIHYAYHNHK